MPYSCPRGTCPVCDRPFTLTLAGRLRVHLAPKTTRYRPPECAGSRRMPKTNDDKETQP